MTGDEDNILLTIVGEDILENNQELKQILMRSRNFEELRNNI